MMKPILPRFIAVITLCFGLSVASSSLVLAETIKRKNINDLTEQWKTTDTHMPLALTEGAPCITGSGVQFVKVAGDGAPEISSLIDVVNGHLCQHTCRL